MSCTILGFGTSKLLSDNPTLWIDNRRARVWRIYIDALCPARLPYPESPVEKYRYEKTPKKIRIKVRTYNSKSKVVVT
jgi:hypothetical protein